MEQMRGIDNEGTDEACQLKASHCMESELCNDAPADSLQRRAIGVARPTASRSGAFKTLRMQWGSK